MTKRYTYQDRRIEQTGFWCCTLEECEFVEHCVYVGETLRGEIIKASAKYDDGKVSIQSGYTRLI